MPTALEALAYSRKLGHDVEQAFVNFHRPTAPLLSSLTTMQLARWLDAQRGSLRHATLAERSGLSRFSCGRFLSGQSEPRLPQFLALLHALTARVEDWVHAWVGIEHVELLRTRHARVTAARAAMFEQPLCLAIMCLLDTVPFERPARAQLSALATTLGRPRRAVQRCVAILVQGGVVSLSEDRYRLTGSLTVDAGADPALERAARSHWTRVALERTRAPSPSDLCSYNVFSIARRDLSELQRLQREFFRAARGLIAASAPTDLAGMLLVHSFVWEAKS